MANPHSSVCYVEPNLVFDRKITDTSEFDYGKIINPEDYCIFFSLTVEMSKREHELKSDFLTLTYTSEGNSGSTNINFMGGTMVEGRYNGDKKDTAKPYLTTRYADMYVTDLEDYGTAEMLGIKSVNIEYESATIPIITIKFTDVRGMSLFTPTELSRTNTTINKKNVEESFFQCFFNFPYPKFYVTVKGFYGKPVTYEVTCDKFNTNFNAESGNFDIDVRFIGYKYSFLTDVSLEAVMAAPHTDYLGKKYWQEQVNANHFVITDIYGNKVGMPTLYELNNKIKDIIASGDPTVSDTTISHEEDTHEEEKRQLEEIKTIYDDWYRTLEQDLVKKYGKDYCYPFKANTTDDDSVYTRIVVLLNKNKEGDTLASDAVQFSEYLKKRTNDLNSAINAYNEKYKSFSKLNNISSDFSQYVRCKLFYPAYINKNTKEIKFGGFHTDNKIPPDEIKKNMFTYRVTEDSGKTYTYKSNYDKVVKIIYNDGVDQYIDCFNIEVDYSNVKKRIDYLTSDANTQVQVKESKKRNHERNIALKKELGWNPTIENFTKIVMAHLETFMYMMHQTCDEIKANPEKRSPEALNVTVGTDGNCPDNANKEFIAPFPRVTKTVTNDDGSQRQEDTWVGEFNSDGWKEMDLVETFFNAIEEIWKQNSLENQIREEKKNESEKTYPCKVKYPITSFDFFLDSDVYGDDIITTFENFVGGVAVRMFDILTINNIKDIKKYASKLGEVEANNFFKSVNVLANKDLLKWVDADTGEFTADNIMSAVTATSDKYPWSIDKKTNSNKPLLGKDNWLSRYELNSGTYSYMYPVQNIKFQTIGDNYNMYAKSDNFENTDNIFSFPPNIDGLVGKFNKVSSNNAHYNLIIEDDYFKIGKILEEVTANGCEAYTGDSLENKSTSISKVLSNESSLDNAIGGGGDNVGYYRTFFKSEKFTSFSKKLGLKASSVVSYQSDKARHDTFKVHVDNKKIISGKFKSSDPSYGLFVKRKEGDDNEKLALDVYFDSEIMAKSINEMFLSEVFGYKGEVREIDHMTSILDMNNYTACDFLMGVEILNYTNLANTLKNGQTFTYIPKLAALQLGAIIDEAMGTQLDTEINDNLINELKKKVVFQDGFDKVVKNYLQKLSVYSRLVLLKYYKKWVNGEFKKIKSSLSKQVVAELRYQTSDYVYTNGGVYDNPHREAKTKTARRLFNENSDFIKELTNNLLLPVLLVNGNVNSFVKDDRKPLSRKSFTASTEVCKNFLKGFIVELNTLLGLKQYTKNEKGDVVRMAKESSHTSDEMRIEFYRYLKQLYDRWIPSSTFADWNFCNFFDSTKDCATSTNDRNDYKFYFIDSYYGKVGDRLVVNPQKLSERLDKFYEDLDVNASLYSLLGWVYGDNRCMLKCVQNFMDLGNIDDMKTMFSAMTYSTAMANIKKGQDFVVVYTYEPSKYLNNSSSEFKDDSFMLNEEFYSPIAIRSRGADNAGKSYYKIPAFGVSYGKQYQSFFKNISFNMGQNVQTEQAIRAKHAILLGRTNKDKNNALAQDLFDIYTTQSYTCTVEMMGCAWVQPMMYFVVLNVPLFRGSYMIMKVSHSITPGNMTTTFTGCRMSNVSNKLIEDVFLDPMADESVPAENNATREEYYADVDNDCGYKVNPIFNTNEASGVKISDDAMTKAVKAMRYIINDRGYPENAAAGICGNIMKESRFDEFAINKNSYAAGLCQWLPAFHLFKDMYDNLYENYGFWAGGNQSGLSKKSDTKDLIKNRSFDYQLKFAIDSVALNKNKYYKDLHATLMKDSISIDDAVHAWCWKYEKPGEKEANEAQRRKYANEIYKKYKGTPQTDNKNEGNEDSKMNEDIYELFFNAVNNTAKSTRGMGFTLTHSYYPKKGAANSVMMLSTASDADKPKLAKVFDCILNTDEYFKYVNELYWVYGTSNPQGTPEHIDVKLSSKAVQPNNQHVYIVETKNVDATKTTQIDGTFNEELLKSLAKKRKSIGKDSTMIKLVPQLAAEAIKNEGYRLKLLDKYVPCDCDNVGSTKAEAPSKSVPASANIMIGRWNVAKSVAYINSHAAECPSGYCGKGKCATYVLEAICCKDNGVFPENPNRIKCGNNPRSGGPATNLHYGNILANNDFKLIKSGDCTPNNRGVPTSNLQAGDVAIIGRKMTGVYHACMWTGSQWVSDYKQGPNKMSPYGKAKQYPEGTLPYFIYRYLNKEGTQIS
jgi:hypothetical protein